MKEALFIVNSPFQALCATEAIIHYMVEKAHFLLFEDDSTIRKMVLPMVEAKGIVHFLETKGNLTLSIVRGLTQSEWKEKYDLVFVGDYYSYGPYVAAITKAKRNARIIYLDDGNSTLSIVPPVSLERGRSQREKAYLKFWDSLAKIKHLQKTLFTIFDLNEGCPLPVEKNTFSSLVPDATLKKNIYIIGTNSDMLLFKDLSYSEYLRHLASYIKNRYPEEKVFYCPHRRDSHDYSGLVSDLGWCMFDTKFSVEIDFVQGKLYPLFIVGFGSTALLTLKKIFPDSEVKTIYMDLTSETDNKGYRSVESYYVDNGIEVIDVREF